MGASGRWIKALVGFTKSDKSKSKKKDDNVSTHSMTFHYKRISLSQLQMLIKDVYFLHYMFVQLVKVKIATKSRFGETILLILMLRSFNMGLKILIRIGAWLIMGSLLQLQYNRMVLLMKNKGRNIWLQRGFKQLFERFWYIITNFIYICLKRYFMITLF